MTSLADSRRDRGSASAGPATNPDTPDEPNGLEPDGSVTFPFNLKDWVAKNRHLMTPPVGNKYIYSGKDFFIMIIAGPNARNDFHMTNSEEFFYQIKGDVNIRTIQNGRIVDCPLREGEVFFILPNVPHSPQRGPDTIGLVVERRRPAGETEHLMFFCEKCSALVYDKEFDCKDIVNHFAEAMEQFWADPQQCTCRTCGHRITKPVPRT